MTDQLYTEKEVADMLAVSVRTVRRLKRSGQLGYFMRRRSPTCWP